MSEENIDPSFGKSWENAFTYKTFKAADEKRNKILESGKKQVKVKRRSDGAFVVKTRNITIETPKKTKKAKKQKRGNNEG